MKYVEYEPAAELRDVVLNYWKFEVFETDDFQFPFAHDMLPEKTISLVFIKQPYFQGVRLLGAHMTRVSQTLHARSIYLGVRWQPWISLPDLFPDKTALLNTTDHAPADVLPFFRAISPTDLALNFSRIDLLEACLKEYLGAISIQRDELVKYICIQLETGERISDVVEAIPMSVRVMQRRFKAVTGLTMKKYSIVVRQRKTWEDIILNEQQFTESIFNNGYYDTAHFINEFRKIMDRSPKDFQAYLRSLENSIGPD